MIIKGLLAAVAKGLGACVLGGWLLWQVVERSGPHFSEVVVHVTASPAVVTIDGRPYQIATWRDSPIVCTLRGGWHELRMWRDERLVYQEKFQVRPGEDVVLTASDPHSR
jgi:hypothetical protein